MGKNKNKLIIDDNYVISRKKGNGVLTRKVWVDDTGEITRYALAYINLNISSLDSGRILGYDNAHDYHHKHLLGKVTPVKFKSFEALHNEYTKKS
ncbi:MAG: transcriptional regulator [Flavobacteriales bacterium]|nr:transcriptional regulator [Flavobacteriales bacterium]